MKEYRLNLNKDNNGYNEVHSELCHYFRELSNYKDLGRFENEIEAVTVARIAYLPTADGCKYCCPNAHKG